MDILILVVIITLAISAQCSLYESALYSARIGVVEAAKGNPRLKKLAHHMIAMKKNITVPISAILILNTIGNTGGAALSGMYAHEVFGTAWVPLFSVVLTLLILFIGEIMPKTLGAVYCNQLWPYIVWPLLIIKYVLYPFIYITQKFSDMFARGKATPHITEEEILGAVKLGAKGGEISIVESRMVHNIIGMEDRQVKEIMTPRPVVFSLAASMPVDEAYRIAREKGFTRIPIYRDDKENIVGYVMVHDLGLEENRRAGMVLESIAKPLAFVEETDDCLKLLVSFLRRRRHIAVVVDEYGGVAGVVTLEDLLETMLGEEIVDEKDQTVDMQVLAQKRKKRREREAKR